MSASGTPRDLEHTGFVADPYASHHVFAADGDGPQAILDLFDRNSSDLNGRITIVHAETALDAAAYTARLQLLPAEVIHNLPTVVTALKRLSAVLGLARTGTRVYASGSMTLVELVLQLAQVSGVERQCVSTEHRAPVAHRVRCVYCQGCTNDVISRFVRCVHCGTELVVCAHDTHWPGGLIGVAARVADWREPQDLVTSIGFGPR